MTLFLADIKHGCGKFTCLQLCFERQAYEHCNTGWFHVTLSNFHTFREEAHFFSDHLCRNIHFHTFFSSIFILNHLSRNIHFHTFVRSTFILKPSIWKYPIPHFFSSIFILKPYVQVPDWTDNQKNY